MSKVLIKQEAKAQLFKNRKYYLQTSLTYFLLFFLILVLPPVLHYINITLKFNVSIPIADFLYTSSNFYIRTIQKILVLALQITISFKIYSNLIMQEEYKTLYKIAWNRFSKFIGIILLIQLPFIALNEIIHHFLGNYEADMVVTFDTLRIIDLITSLLYSVVSVLLYFSTCAFALNQNNSICNTLVNSTKLIIRNILNWLIFELSFVLWYLIPVILSTTILSYAGISLFDLLERNFLLLSELIIFAITPLLFGIGLYFFPYYHISKLGFYRISRK